MRIVPAVDIRGGLCVNLVQGDYGQETVYAAEPVEQAALWWTALEAQLTPNEMEEAIIHIVDLDGAKTGSCCVLPQLQELKRRRIRFEVGGGLRSLEALESVFEAGASRAILGTAAYRDPELLREACRRWPGRIAAGIDARDGFLSLNAWLEDTRASALEFAHTVEAAGAARIIYTDILSDGMMKGPNYETTAATAKAVSIPVTISGGIASLDNMRTARGYASAGIDEIIVGRALYEGEFTIGEAIAVLKEGS
ncbi:MAG: 1-(5-phosphoribosyl)-5-((5-phosphoribosylamino)methylideneamino)imidazole-4-carboxamide isomerase [Candidatus Hydrogenedentes bacterium]|nr:1-(5-phosphoribosyl)-5-((5-phosphoribosylamino)methylideneamino)imidazole-4-carboxamide isomerase [Candidatus Hydrogenedentota bacterium]